MYCTECGHKLEDSSKFCSACGAEVNILDEIDDVPLGETTQPPALNPIVPKKERDKSSIKRTSCLLALISSLVLCFFAPFVAVNLLSFYEQPTAWQIVSNQVPVLGSIYMTTGFWASAFLFITIIVGLVTIRKSKSKMTHVLAIVAEIFMILAFIESLMWYNEGLEGYLGFGFWAIAFLLLIIISDT